MKKILLFALLPLLISCNTQDSELKLPALFSDHMVLQQDTLVSIWGWAAPGSKVFITSTWGESGKVRTDKFGRWSLKLPTGIAGEAPGSMLFRAGKDSVYVNDILFGELWLCSGQSNMEMPVKGWPPNDPIHNSEAEIAAADYSQIRMFTVQKDLAFSGRDDCSGLWEVASPATVDDFSATAYFFGRELHQKLKVPVGLIHSSWGGTPAESWTHPGHLEFVAGYENINHLLSNSIDSSRAYENWLGTLKTIEIDVADDAFYEHMDLDDSGMETPDLDDSDWLTMPVPSTLEQQLGYFDGVIWFRKEFQYSGDADRDDLTLFLGPIDDIDVTYLNGQRIGGIERDGFWQTVRNYPVPFGLLKKGSNVVAVRVTDIRGGGGIYGNEKVGLRSGEQMVTDLTGDWKFKPAAVTSGNTMYVFGAGVRSYAAMPPVPLQLNQYTPSVIYNAMISPLVPYTIRGAIWYQGESNVGRGEQYRELFPAMINSWRNQWNSNFPFYYVQIAPYNYNESVQGVTAELRDAQMLTLKEPNVGMVVTTDIGNPSNIHPANKQEVGRRLALWARAKDYGENEIVHSGPIYHSMKVSGSNAVISFDHTGSGLYSPDKELTFFEVAGSDGVFHQAKAFISKNNVLVNSDEVEIPVAVRFGWSDIAEPNLFNREGLPASPFRTMR